MQNLFSIQTSNVTDRQVGNLYDQASFAILGNVGVGILFVVLLWDVADTQQLAVWLSLMVFTNVIRSFLLFRYRKKPESGTSTSGLFQLHIVVTITGLLWGASSLIAMQLSGSVYQVFSLLVLSGIGGASIATLGSMFSCYLILMLPPMLPMTIWLLLQDEFLLMGAGMLSAFYILVIVRASHRFGSALKLSYELAEEQLRLVSRLDEANRSKGEFLAKMSHEIRTPMNGVLGMAEVLSTTDLSQQQRGFLNTISSSGGALLAVMNDILDFSRMQHGSFELHETRFNLEELCIEATSIFVASVRKKNLDLVINIAPSMPLEIEGDAARIRQIIVNLISNAVKSTDTGYIALKVSSQGIYKNDLIIKFEIEDTGIGIETEKQRKLFQPFVQSDHSIDGITGSGLGLSICSELVELMHGDIGIESIPGIGSTFWFTVKIKQSENVWEANYPSGKVGEHLRILLFETNPLYADIMFSYLKRAPAHVELLSHVKELEDKLSIATKAETGYDLVIFSGQLNGGEYLKFLSTIQDYKKNSDLKLMYCMEDNIHLPESEQNAIHIDGFVNLPVTPIKLNEAINCIFAEANKEKIQPVFSNTNLTPSVLVAEDDVVSQQVVRELLKAMGCEVQIVDNGSIALERIKQQKFDILFLDGELPGLTGWQVSALIREYEKAESIKRLPIIILTAFSIDVVRDKTEEGVIDAYLAKPIDYERLEASVKKFIKTSQQSVSK